jgi:DNA-binding SARP family transcriptional activator
MISDLIQTAYSRHAFTQTDRWPEMGDPRGPEVERGPYTLTASLLGQPEIFHGDRRVAFRSKRVLALLVFLAITNQSQARERLATLFWPDHDGLSARKLLRNLVVLLRQNLADATHLPYENISLVCAEHDALGRPSLRIDQPGEPALMLDTAYVEQAATMARRARQAHAPQASDQALNMLEALETAVQKYRGPFLEGVAFEDAPDLDAWIRQQQAFYEQQMEHVFETLTALYAEMGSFSEASRVARRWLEVNPFEEVATQRLMQALAAQGDRTGALAAYGATKRILRAHLDTDPTPETVAVAERIRRTTTSPSPATTPTISTQVAQRTPRQRFGGPGGDTIIPFVGRSAEFATLVRTYEMARHGQPQTVMLEGEAGIGKTRVADEFLRWVQTRGAVILRACALEMIDHLPFQPLTDALRPRIAQENAPDDLLADPWLAEMIRLLPELHDRYPDLPTPSALADGEATIRGRLFEAVTQLIHALAKRADAGGVVLFLDSAQWMDAATLDLLQYAVHHWAANGSPILLVLGARTEAVALTPRLDTWLAGLERESALHRIMLLPLSPDEARCMLFGLGAWICGSEEHSGPRHQPGALLDWLFRRTGGRPFYLLEMARTLREQGVILCEQTREGQAVVRIAEDLDLSSLAHVVPSTVRDLIRNRVAAVNDVAADVLVAASVLGKVSTFDQLRTLAEVSEREALLALDDLMRRRLLVLAPKEQHSQAHGAHKSRYMFPHDLVGETVYTEAGEDRRRIFHARAFRMFVSSETQAGDAAEGDLSVPSVTCAAEMAHHALMAGMLELAFRYSLAAADAATQALGADDARALYEQALQTAGELARQARASDVQSCVNEADLEWIATQVGLAEAASTAACDGAVSPHQFR